jgi:soluble lytic murein transglycosylase-like protein
MGPCPISAMFAAQGADDARNSGGMRLRSGLAKLLMALSLGASLAGCSGLATAPGTASLAIAEAAPEPAPAEAAPPETEPAPVLSYAEVNGPSDDVEALMAYYADAYDVPLSLVRHTAGRESGFNPAARNGPYWGIMQILPATARTMGYDGPREGLLDPDTNLRYAVKYLAGAWLVSGGDAARADRLYRSGYYYDAKRLGLLEETGLRP